MAQRAGTVQFGFYVRAHDAAMHRRMPARALPCPAVHCWTMASACPSAPAAGARRPVAFQSNSLHAVQQAVRAGLGAGLLPHYGRSRCQLAKLHDVPEVTREIWLAYPAEFRGHSRFRPVIDWLQQTLATCP